ncbi:hypothetical protein BC828DRAFT_391918 [Blastocladiella britannica]|nr:hypothetical protein BC828DRAFT_391918 [Blastocladiella britannica]
MLNLKDLPDDILAHLPRYLDLVAAVRLRSICRSLRILPHIALSHPKLSLLVSALEGDADWFARALIHPSLNTAYCSSSFWCNSYSNTRKVAELLVRFQVTHRSTWLALAAHSRGSLGGFINVSRLLVVAAQENLPEMLPLVTLNESLGPVPELAHLAWHADSVAAERVYAIFDALHNSEHEYAASWRNGLDKARRVHLNQVGNRCGPDWLSNARWIISEK